MALLAGLILAPLFAVGRRVRRLSIQAQERFADAVGYAGETLDALDTVQAFGREGVATRRFKSGRGERLRRLLWRASAPAPP